MKIFQGNVKTDKIAKKLDKILQKLLKRRQNCSNQTIAEIS